ncbi:MAG TPA: NAD(P)H-dependent oxidoreductase [Candidatus Methylacidiphilales bacterium]|nr:NAD(P)H-dependent oxidoreductase [Candidatus Methylacidiphilales bacterium]
MSISITLDTATLLANLQWRYATKVFDPAKIIPVGTWKALEEILILTPSSYGLQPWKFLVITDPELKVRLKPHSWNQSQVTDCSHYVVFASLRKMSEAHIDAFFARAVEIRGGSLDSLKGYRNMIVGDLIHGARSRIAGEWAARQAYIALGNFMTAAALLQIDTCPMEGFVPAEYDKILGLEERGLTAAVCCAAGYRSETDKYARLPKVRFKITDMIEHL